VRQYDWSKVAPLYDETLERLVASIGATE